MTKLDSIEIAPDIGTIVEATPEEEETTIDSVQIVGVPLLDVCKACLQCKARVEPMTPPHGKCRVYRKATHTSNPTTPLPIRLLDITPDSKTLMYIRQ